VPGWFRGEFSAIGEDWLDHDERYRRSAKFIRAQRGICGQNDVTFKGDFYRVNNYTMKPKLDVQPKIFQGGASRAARVWDWHFTNGNTPDGLAKRVDDIRSKGDRQVKIGVNAFAIARQTEARAVLDGIVSKANPDAVQGFAHKVKCAGKPSPEGAGNRAKSSFKDLVQYNDGLRCNLIGTPPQIAERFLMLKDAGADLILLGVLHLQEQVAFFGKHLIPLVRPLQAARARSVALCRASCMRWSPSALC